MIAKIADRGGPGREVSGGYRWNRRGVRLSGWCRVGRDVGDCPDDGNDQHFVQEAGADSHEDLPALLVNYRRMRALLAPDWCNPHLNVSTSMLESGSARTKDFVEGYALTAIALT